MAKKKKRKVESDQRTRMTLRIPTWLHDELIERSDKDGISVNGLITDLLMRGIGMRYPYEKLSKADRQYLRKLEKATAAHLKKVIFENLSG